MRQERGNDEKEKFFIMYLYGAALCCFIGGLHENVPRGKGANEW